MCVESGLSILLTFFVFLSPSGGGRGLLSIIHSASQVKTVKMPLPPPPVLSTVATCDGAISPLFEEQCGAQEIAHGQNTVAAARCFPRRGLRPLFLSSQLPFVSYITAQLQKTEKCTAFEDRL